MSGSDVARLMQQIELEAQAAQLAMHGFAIVAKHQFITHRYDAIGRCQEKLQAIVGEQQASALMIAAYEKSLNQEGELMRPIEPQYLSCPKPVTSLTTPPIIKIMAPIVSSIFQRVPHVRKSCSVPGMHAILFRCLTGSSCAKCLTAILRKACSSCSKTANHILTGLVSSSRGNGKSYFPYPFLC